MSIAHPGPSNIWAGSAAPADIAEPADGVKDAGYTGTPAPVYQYVNWLLKYLFQGIRHVLTRGIPDWNADEAIAETYAVGDVVRVDGEVKKVASIGPVVLEKFGHTPTELQAAVAPTLSTAAGGFSLTAGSISGWLETIIGPDSATPVRAVHVRWYIPLTAGAASEALTFIGTGEFDAGVAVVQCTLDSITGAPAAPLAAPRASPAGQAVTVNIAVGGSATGCTVNLSIYGY